MEETIATSDGTTYTEDQVLYLANEVKDFQINHGSQLKVVQFETESSVPARPVGASILPTTFPRKRFEEAVELQQVFNELYIRVASDPDWLYSVLEPLIEQDDFIAALWDVYVKVREANAIQDVVCGVFRSDYMLHKVGPDSGETELKQVEINTFFCAGACHAERIANMHRHLGRVRGLGQGDISRSLLQSRNTQSIVELLTAAHSAYKSTISRNESRQKCILMIVQPFNFNSADERPIEYGLWNAEIPCYRCEWQSVLQLTTLTEDCTLLFSPLVGDVELEVSVVYYRAGFDAEEYSGQTEETRTRLEMSRAIKCPDILTHLTNFKSVQQALSLPGALEHFLTTEKCERIRRTFMPMHALDSSREGLEARTIARDPKQAVSYVLKPNRDGGGHNIYGSDIPGFLAKEPQKKWRNYVLMRLIEPPPVTGTLMMLEDLYLGDVVSELGVLGTCLWRRDTSGKGTSEVEVIRNEVGGWTFKTKPKEVDEMSVVKGYGCFDCPLLVD